MSNISPLFDSLDSPDYSETSTFNHLYNIHKSFNPNGGKIFNLKELEQDVSYNHFKESVLTSNKFNVDHPVINFLENFTKKSFKVSPSSNYKMVIPKVSLKFKNLRQDHNQIDSVISLIDEDVTDKVNIKQLLWGEFYDVLGGLIYPDQSTYSVEFFNEYESLYKTGGMAIDALDIMTQFMPGMSKSLDGMKKNIFIPYVYESEKNWCPYVISGLHGATLTYQTFNPFYFIRSLSNIKRHTLAEKKANTVGVYHAVDLAVSVASILTDYYNKNPFKGTSPNGLIHTKLNLYDSDGIKLTVTTGNYEKDDSLYVNNRMQQFNTSEELTSLYIKGLHNTNSTFGNKLRKHWKSNSNKYMAPVERGLLENAIAHDTYSALNRLFNYNLVHKHRDFGFLSGNASYNAYNDNLYGFDVSLDLELEVYGKLNFLESTDLAKITYLYNDYTHYYNNVTHKGINRHHSQNAKPNLTSLPFSLIGDDRLKLEEVDLIDQKDWKTLAVTSNQDVNDLSIKYFTKDITVKDSGEDTKVPHTFIDLTSTLVATPKDGVDFHPVLKYFLNATYSDFKNAELTHDATDKEEKVKVFFTNLKQLSKDELNILLNTSLLIKRFTSSHALDNTKDSGLSATLSKALYSKAFTTGPDSKISNFQQLELEKIETQDGRDTVGELSQKIEDKVNTNSASTPVWIKNNTVDSYIDIKSNFKPTDSFPAFALGSEDTIDAIEYMNFATDAVHTNGRAALLTDNFTILTLSPIIEEKLTEEKIRADYLKKVNDTNDPNTNLVNQKTDLNVTMGNRESPYVSLKTIPVDKQSIILSHINGLSSNFVKQSDIDSEQNLDEVLLDDDLYKILSTLVSDNTTNLGLSDCFVNKINKHFESSEDFNYLVYDEKVSPHLRLLHLEDSDAIKSQVQLYLKSQMSEKNFTTNVHNDIGTLFKAWKIRNSHGITDRDIGFEGDRLQILWTIIQSEYDSSINQLVNNYFKDLYTTKPRTEIAREFDHYKEYGSLSSIGHSSLGSLENIADSEEYRPQVEIKDTIETYTLTPPTDEDIEIQQDFRTEIDNNFTVGIEYLNITSDDIQCVYINNKDYKELTNITSTASRDDVSSSIKNILLSSVYNDDKVKVAVSKNQFLGLNLLTHIDEVLNHKESDTLDSKLDSVSKDIGYKEQDLFIYTEGKLEQLSKKEFTNEDSIKWGDLLTDANKVEIVKKSNANLTTRQTTEAEFAEAKLSSWRKNFIKGVGSKIKSLTDLHQNFINKGWIVEATKNLSPSDLSQTYPDFFKLAAFHYRVIGLDAHQSFRGILNMDGLDSKTIMANIPFEKGLKAGEVNHRLAHLDYAKVHAETQSRVNREVFDNVVLKAAEALTNIPCIPNLPTDNATLEEFVNYEKQIKQLREDFTKAFDAQKNEASDMSSDDFLQSFVQSYTRAVENKALADKEGGGSFGFNKDFLIKESIGDSIHADGFAKFLSKVEEGINEYKKASMAGGFVGNAKEIVGTLTPCLEILYWYTITLSGAQANSLFKIENFLQRQLYKDESQYSTLEELNKALDTMNFSEVKSLYADYFDKKDIRTELTTEDLKKFATKQSTSTLGSHIDFSTEETVDPFVQIHDADSKQAIFTDIFSRKTSDINIPTLHNHISEEKDVSKLDSYFTLNEDSYGHIPGLEYSADNVFYLDRSNKIAKTKLTTREELSTLNEEIDEFNEKYIENRINAVLEEYLGHINFASVTHPIRETLIQHNNNIKETFKTDLLNDFKEIKTFGKSLDQSLLDKIQGHFDNYAFEKTLEVVANTNEDWNSFIKTTSLVVTDSPKLDSKEARAVSHLKDGVIRADRNKQIAELIFATELLQSPKIQEFLNTLDSKIKAIDTKDKFREDRVKFERSVFELKQTLTSLDNLKQKLTDTHGSEVTSNILDKSSYGELEKEDLQVVQLDPLMSSYRETKRTYKQLVDSFSQTMLMADDAKDLDPTIERVDINRTHLSQVNNKSTQIGKDFHKHWSPVYKKASLKFSAMPKVEYRVSNYLKVKGEWHLSMDLLNNYENFLDSKPSIKIEIISDKCFNYLKTKLFKF